MGPLSWLAIALAMSAADGPARTDCAAPDAAPRWRAQVREARAALGVDAWAASGGGDGAGVTLAVIDTGFDVRHRSLAGRARWVLDRTRAPLGAHRALEQRFEGAVWSEHELRAAIERERAEGRVDERLPTDRDGHGTLVASIAAGAGDATTEGVAPGASLVLIRVRASPDAGVGDDELVTAMDFAIDRAGDGPLVLVMAAGSIDGAHDGSSALERAIEGRFAGEARRALVVAAGNEGGGPAHSRVSVERTHGEVALDFTTSAAPGETVSFAVVHEGPVDLALESPRSQGARRTRWVSLGEHPGAQLGDDRVGIDRTRPPADGASIERALVEGVAPRVSLVTIEHGAGATQREPATARATRPWRLWLRGQATIDLYGDADALRFERGSDEGTLVVPATALGAVSVGALATRDQWEGRDGATRARPVARGEDGVARFSSRGPDRVHRPEPDLSAPGAWVLGARSGQCDPRAPRSLCAEDRLTSDPHSLAAAGTSVSAPLAAGALARLWSSRPDLSREAALSRLTASSERWSAARGWGAVDLRAAAMEPDVAAVRCTLVATVDAVAPGEPVSFALRALGARGAIGPAPVVRAEVVPSSRAPRVVSLEGGRAIIETRAPARGPVETLAVTATLEGGARCEATVRVQRRPPLPAASLGSCAARPSPTAPSRTRDERSTALLVLVGLSAGGLRRSRGRC